MTRTLNPIRFGLNPRDIPFPELPAQVRAAEEAGARVLGPVTQAAFLLELGLETRAQALMTAAPEHRQEIDQSFHRLTDDGGMGRLFKVLALTSPGQPPPPGFK